MSESRSDNPVIQAINDNNGNLSVDFIAQHGDTLFYNEIASAKFMREHAKSLSNEVMFNLTQSLMAAHLQQKPQEGLLRASGFLSGRLYTELATRTGYDPWDKNHPVPEHFNVLNWYVHSSISSNQLAQAKTNEASGKPGTPVSAAALAEMTMGVILTKTKKEDTLANMMDPVAIKAQVAKEEQDKKDPERIAANISAKVKAESAPVLPENYDFKTVMLYKAVQEIFTSEDKFINDLVAMRQPLKDMHENKQWNKKRKGTDEFYGDLDKMIGVAERIKEKYPNGMRDVMSVKDNAYVINEEKLKDYMKMENDLLELAVKITGDFKNADDFMSDCKLAFAAGIISENQRQNMPHKLITPVQRMPRHELLFKAALNYAKEGQAKTFDEAISVVKGSFQGKTDKAEQAYSEEMIVKDVNTIKKFIADLPMTSGTKKQYLALMKEVDRCISEKDYKTLLQPVFTQFRELAHAALNKTHGSKESKSKHYNIRELSDNLIAGIKNKLKADDAKNLESHDSRESSLTSSSETDPGLSLSDSQSLSSSASDIASSADMTDDSYEPELDADKIVSGLKAYRQSVEANSTVAPESTPESAPTAMDPPPSIKTLGKSAFDPPEPPKQFTPPKLEVPADFDEVMKRAAKEQENRAPASSPPPVEKTSAPAMEPPPSIKTLGKSAFDPPEPPKQFTPPKLEVPADYDEVMKRAASARAEERNRYAQAQVKAESFRATPAPSPAIPKIDARQTAASDELAAANHYIKQAVKAEDKDSKLDLLDKADKMLEKAHAKLDKFAVKNGVNSTVTLTINAIERLSEKTEAMRTELHATMGKRP